MRKPTNPWFRARAPYVYGVVEIAGVPVRLPTAIVRCDSEKVAIGDPIGAVFERVDGQVTQLHFAPRRA